MGLVRRPLWFLCLYIIVAQLLPLGCPFGMPSRSISLVGALFCASIDVVLLLTVRSYLDKINNITVYWIGVLALCLLKCVKDEVKTIYDDKFFKTITFDKINKIVNA